jgi:hypothetical protein
MLGSSVLGGIYLPLGVASNPELEQAHNLIVSLGRGFALVVQLKSQTWAAPRFESRKTTVWSEVDVCSKRGSRRWENEVAGCTAFWRSTRF